MHHDYQAIYTTTWHYIFVKPNPRLLKYQLLIAIPTPQLLKISLTRRKFCGLELQRLGGAVIASVALLLFAPLFSTLYALTSPPTEHWNILGLTLLMLIGSALAVWWLVAATGAAVGWALYRLATYDAGGTSSCRRD